MNKNIALSAVFVAILLFPNNSANANTYMSALSRAVDQIVEIHKGPEVINISEPAPKKEKAQTKVKKVEKKEIKKILTVTATAYSSSVDQTDDTPCITSTGYNVCNKTKNIIAVSRDLVRSLGYGTQVMFPDLFGDEVFHIEDTMNARFISRIDFHLDSREKAKNFGVKRQLTMVVF
ncbi:MAG: hypothetical protein WD989_02340 [Candidatus Paceibacterota bacterium]